MRKHTRAGLFLILIVLVGCSGSDAYSGDAGDDVGATPGGVKDLTLARDLIAQGLVPPGDAVLVEAMFSEHDLPLEGPACTQLLCVRAAAGLAPEVDGTPRGWAQVGLSSGIDRETWQRPSTTFVFVVDVSGSMSWGYAGGGTPGELARVLLHDLTAELRPDDRVAMVTYGSDVDTVLGLTSGADAADVHDVIDELHEDGSTNMEAGMRRAYEIGEDALGSTAQVRVIVFTDTQPNVGATGGSEFEQMVGDAAAGGVFTTTLALGLGIGPEVMRAMAALRGANAFSMSNGEDVATFMAERYPWFTTPIAHDLRVNVATDAWGVDRGLGFPAGSDAEQQGLKAASVFLSPGRRGAMLVAFEPPVDPESLFSAAFELSYNEVGGGPRTQTLGFGHDGTPLDAAGQWFEQRGVARTTALALLTEAMHDACVAYASDHDEAEAILAPAVERFETDATALGDADLVPEVELSQALLALIREDAPQGTLYPY